MKNIIVAMLLLIALPVFTAEAQQPAQPAPTAPAPETSKTIPELLSWLVGEWEGEGKSQSDREFLGKMSVRPVLDNTALLISRESMNKEGGPAGGLKEILLIGYDGTTKKIVATMYDNKNAIALFVGEIKNGEVVFNLATSAPGYVNRRIFKRDDPQSFSFVIEGASDGKAVSKVLEIDFKKKS